MKNIFRKVLLAVYIVAVYATSFGQTTPPCTVDSVGVRFLQTLDYMAVNHLITNFTGSGPQNLILNGDFEKDLSGLILQSTHLPADYQCICSSTCINTAHCNASGSNPYDPGYHISNFTDMMSYLDFNTQLDYSWDWNFTYGVGYFAVRRPETVNTAYRDHTSAAYGYGGQAMMVDGPENLTATGYKQAWVKTFNLLPNKTYKFTYWFLGFPLSPGTAAKFSFGVPKPDGTFTSFDNLEVDDVSYAGTWPYTPSNNQWHKLSGTVTTTSSNYVITIAIYTYFGPNSSNNDCVFDDLSLVEVNPCPVGVSWAQTYADHIQLSLNTATRTDQCTQCNVNLMRMPGDPYYDFSNIIHVTNLRPDPNYTGSRNAFLVTVEIADRARPGSAHTFATMSGFYDCDYLFDCDRDNCCVIKGDVVNPFVQGLRGNWKANKAYLYNASRRKDPTPVTRPNSNQGLYVRQSGVYDQFSEFWHYDGTRWQPNGASSVNWSWKAEVTKTNPYGADVENRDPLNRYSAAVYGYNYSAAIAIGNNTRYRQMAYDGFEDYDFFDPQCQTRHFNFKEPSLIMRAHTGLKSLRVTPGNKIGINRDVTTAGTPDPLPADPIFGNQYTVTDHDMLGVFKPDDDADYVLSFWALEELPTESIGKPSLDAMYFNYPDPAVNILFNSSLITPTNIERGKIIERWQQITYTFHIPAGSTTMELQFLGDQSNKNLNIYYDDIRIYPIKATMKSYVYNPVTLKLMAELDENNYATLYEYDLEGKLSRVKKETEKGIYSIQESRTSMPKR